MSADKYMLQLEATAEVYYRMARNSSNAANQVINAVEREWLRHLAGSYQLTAREISADVREYFGRE